MSEKAQTKLNWKPVVSKNNFKIPIWYNKTINHNINSFDCCVEDIKVLWNYKTNEK